MKWIAVFCGSRSGASTSFGDAAHAFGEQLAARNIGLVYGGASTGLMGTVADAVLEAGGSVIGVLPHSLATRERAHTKLTELILVDTLAERKHQMAKRSDAFVALPGGFGTLDEVFEMITWTQLQLQSKPVGILNVDGFYDHQLAMTAVQVEQGFVPPEHTEMLISLSDPEALIDQLLAAAESINAS
ncbi:MAG: TIGR00730 family Rossman fold protein [Pseudomonadota bacterium]